MVTLHEEIRAVLLARSRQMTTQEIADEVNLRANYLKRDGSPVTAFQVHGRTRKYSEIFTRDGSRVGLVECSAGNGTGGRGLLRRPHVAAVPSLTPSTEERPSWATPDIRALPPVAGSDARLLILGTMPGAESLRLQQYYAHPRNQFWRIVSEAFGREAPGTYRDRVAFLIEEHIALWDVLEACAREGSLDSKIVPGSERPSDIAGFLRKHPDVRTIALNGGTAMEVFRRWVAPQLVNLDRALKVMQLPSTSPAHTASYAAKLSQWRPIVLAAA